MSRILLGPGAEGFLVTKVQQALLKKGFDPSACDGRFGSRTAKALIAFQEQHHLSCHPSCPEPAAGKGKVDENCWNLLVEAPIPSLFERCLQLTASFEGHNFTQLTGNFDGAGITWGIIGFTLRSGQIPALILKIKKTHPAILPNAFGTLSRTILSICKASWLEQLHWANSIYRAHSRTISPEWRQAFARLGDFPEVQKLQIQQAHRNFFLPALKTAHTLQLSTERAIALCFDIYVQNGGLRPGPKQKITSELRKLEPADPPKLKRRRAEQNLVLSLEGELSKLKIIARVVACHARQLYQRDVLARKLTIAEGKGWVHNKKYLLKNWGIAPIRTAVID